MSTDLSKRKPLIKRSQTLGLPEPTRDSLFDVLCENLESAKRNIFVNRIIYLGEHSFDHENTDGCANVFLQIVKEVNESYNDEPLTGLFISYKKFFIHMLEGSEDSIMKHFILFKEDEEYSKFSNMKLVSIVNHINQRFIMDWTKIQGKPATLLETIDPESDMEKSGRYIYNCIQKIYHLGKEIRETRKTSIKNNEEDDEELLMEETSQSLSFSYESNVQDFTNMQAFFPETNLLQFLVQTRFLRGIDEYVKSYECPMVADTYLDLVWPIPSTMVPYSIFEKPKDPCTDLPTHKQQRVTEDVIIIDDLQVEGGNKESLPN